MRAPIKTPQTHPDHETVGRHFGGHSMTAESTQIYFCDSYDPAIGFWMTNIDASQNDRRNVSERAIGRTFYKAENRGVYWWVTQWGVKVETVAFKEAYHKAGLTVDSHALMMFHRFYEQLRDVWTGDESQFVMELVFGYAALPYAQSKFKIIWEKIQTLDLQDIAQSFRTISTDRLPLSDKEILWLTLRYVDAYEDPK